MNDQHNFPVTVQDRNYQLTCLARRLGRHSLQLSGERDEQDRQFKYSYKGNIEARRCVRWCSGQANCITHYECVSVVLVIQHAKRMRHVVLSSVACHTLQYFSTYLINGKVFGEKKIWDIKKCFNFFYNFGLKHFSF
jgi:hypothetical protein